MPRTFVTLFVAAAFALLAGQASAQNQIPPEKQKLIAEMIATFKMDEQMPRVMDAVMAEEQKTYAKRYAAKIDLRTGLTTAEKQSLKAESAAAFAAFGEKFRKRVSESIDYERFIQEAVYPIYDRMYSEQEMKDIIAFYRSPTGRKIIDTIPQLVVESQKAVQEKFLPQIMPIVESLLKESMETAGPPRRARRRN